MNRTGLWQWSQPAAFSGRLLRSRLYGSWKAGLLKELACFEDSHVRYISGWHCAHVVAGW
jgi:hypothetical protein